jgi:hypothetical protein
MSKTKEDLCLRLWAKEETMSKKYSVELTAEQMKLISDACELMVRIQLGQIHEVVEHLPLKDELDGSKKFALKSGLSLFMSAVLTNGVDGYNSSLGLGNAKLPESNNILWDIKNVLNYEVYTDEAIDNGLITAKGERDWSQMISTKYDTPTQYGKEPLPKVTIIENE